jgi:hypothetical protein
MHMPTAQLSVASIMRCYSLSCTVVWLISLYLACLPACLSVCHILLCATVYSRFSNRYSSLTKPPNPPASSSACLSASCHPRYLLWNCPFPSLERLFIPSLAYQPTPTCLPLILSTFLVLFTLFTLFTLFVALSSSLSTLPANNSPETNGQWRR